MGGTVGVFKVPKLCQCFWSVEYRLSVSSMECVCECVCANDVIMEGGSVPSKLCALSWLESVSKRLVLRWPLLKYIFTVLYPSERVKTHCQPVKQILRIKGLDWN